MRERVTEHIPADEVDVQLKLGPGGLRDIEFTVQLLQLVHGATDAAIRQAGTLPALAALAEHGYVGREESAEFSRDYRILRALEHRLQLARLRRTHLMPRDDAATRVLARPPGSGAAPRNSHRVAGDAPARARTSTSAPSPSARSRRSRRCPPTGWSSRASRPPDSPRSASAT